MVASPNTMNELPDCLPGIADLLESSQIGIQTGAHPFPTLGKGVAGAQAEIAGTLDGILSAFTEKHRAEIPKQPASSKGQSKDPTLEKYDFLILCDGSADSETGAMGVGVQVIHPGNGKKLLKNFSIRLQNAQGEDYCGTSPVAELVGLIYACYLANSLDGKVAIGTDSINSIQWINGEFKINEEHIAQLVAYAMHWRAARKCPTEISKVPRELNAGVDELARKAIGKGERQGRIPLTVKQFTGILTKAGVSDASNLALGMKLYLDSNWLKEYLHGKKVGDEIVESIISAVSLIDHHK